MSFCGKCGKENPSGMSYCGHCGSALTPVSISTEIARDTSRDESNELNSIVYEGFSVLVTIDELMTSEGIKRVGDLPGVYLVIYTQRQHPRFLEVGTGGHFKGRDPNVSIERLESKWVENTSIIYIGQTTDSLRKRINKYMRYGQGEPVAHHGGRFIWQIEGSRELMMCWKPMKGNEDPEEEEKRMIKVFVDTFGKLPFANLRE